MNVFTFWHKINHPIPPYVLLSLVSMKRIFGDKLTVLTMNNIRFFLKDFDLDRQWVFEATNKNISDNVSRIVAFSDYIRMKYCLESGGFWLDADTIVIKDITKSIGDFGKKLLWHSEAVFGAEKGHPVIKAACESMESSRKMKWGNPGGIKELIASSECDVQAIPFALVNPGYSPTYQYSTCNVMFEQNISPSDFLKNKDACIIKLYNTDFSQKIYGMSVADFLKTDTLLAKIFLYLDSDADKWIADSDAINEFLDNFCA